MKEKKRKLVKYYLYPYEVQRHIFDTRKPMTMNRVRYYFSQLATFAIRHRGHIRFRVYLLNTGDLTIENIDEIKHIVSIADNIKLRFKED